MWMINKTTLFSLLFPTICWATFSIVAVDPETGEVGSAGGSCIAGSIIISDVHISQGVIHTQSYYHPTNQNNASNYMIQGHSPQEIIDYLKFSTKLRVLRYAKDCGKNKNACEVFGVKKSTFYKWKKEFEYHV